jgi:hypothetical protein
VCFISISQSSSQLLQHRTRIALQQASKPADVMDAIASSSGLSAFLVSNLHLIAFALIAIYFVGKWLRVWMEDRASRSAVGATVPDDVVQDKMRAARERQFLAGRERRMNEAAGQQNITGGTAQRTLSSSPPRTNKTTGQQDGRRPR